MRFYKITGSGSDFKKVGKIPLNFIHKSVIRIKDDKKNGIEKDVEEQLLNILLHPVTGIIMQ